MWGHNWFKKRKSKKAFRIIAMNQGMKNIQPLNLSFLKHIENVNTSKKIIERIVEKRNKEIRILQPLHMQAIHIHITHHVQKVKKQSVNGKKMFHKDLLRKEIKRLQYLSFLEEQEYFRTRPTMARNLFQNMIKGKEPYILQGGDKVKAIHLEILKNAITEEKTYQSIENKAQPIQAISNSISNYTLISQVVEEVRRQMKKETWRTGGKG